jgi:hypothetical protein
MANAWAIIIYLRYIIRTLTIKLFEDLDAFVELLQGVPSAEFLWTVVPRYRLRLHHVKFTVTSPFTLSSSLLYFDCSNNNEREEKSRGSSLWDNETLQLLRAVQPNMSPGRFQHIVFFGWGCQPQAQATNVNLKPFQYYERETSLSVSDCKETQITEKLFFSKNTTLCYVAPCSLYKLTDASEEHTVSIFRIEK